MGIRFEWSRLQPVEFESGKDETPYTEVCTIKARILP
jgi:hypothetical protein